MFVVLLTYLKPLADIDQHLVEHRTYLEECYRLNYLVASGPQNPRTGGVLISQLKNRAQLEMLLQKDPFAEHNLASYQVIEFDPVKYHPAFAAFIN